MDSNMASTLIGAIVGGALAILASVGTTWWTLKWQRKQEQERVQQEQERIYQERLEEIQELALQVKSWIEFEEEQWDISTNIGGNKKKNSLSCPIDRFEMLINRYEPTLRKTVMAIRSCILTVKNVDLELWANHESSDDVGYTDYVKPAYDNFKEHYEEMERLFEDVNKKNAKKLRLS